MRYLYISHGNFVYVDRGIAKDIFIFVFLATLPLKKGIIVNISALSRKGEKSLLECPPE